MLYTYVHTCTMYIWVPVCTVWATPHRSRYIRMHLIMVWVDTYLRQWMALTNLLLSSVSHLTSPNDWEGSLWNISLMYVLTIAPAWYTLQNKNRSSKLIVYQRNFKPNDRAVVHGIELSFTLGIMLWLKCTLWISVQSVNGWTKGIVIVSYMWLVC